MNNDNIDKLIELDGVVYTEDMTKLVSYPKERPGEEYVVPDGVIEIGSHAFAGAIYLRRVTLPATVRVIGDYAFCGAHIEVNLPSSVSEIGVRAYAPSQS